MGKKIVFLEFIDEAELFLNWCDSAHLSLNDFLIIALQPNVQSFLKRNNIFYENTSIYFSNQSHTRTLLKSEEWYQLIKKSIDLKDEPDIRETYNNSFLFHVRFYMHHFLFYIEILIGLSEKYHVDCMYACLYQDSIHINYSPIIQDKDRYMGHIAKLYAQKHGIIFQEIPKPHFSGISENKKSMTNKIFQNISDKLFYYFFLSRLVNKNIIILASTGYNINKFASLVNKKISKAEIRWVVFLDDTSFRCVLKFFTYRLLKIFKNERDLTPIPMKILKNRVPLISERKDTLNRNIEKFIAVLKCDLYTCFFYAEVNFIEIFIKKIEHDLKQHILHLQSNSEALKDIFKEYNVKFLISPFAREISLILGELSTNMRIPSLLISHGTIIKPKNELEEIEYYHMGKSLLLCDYYSNIAIQTPSEEKHFYYYRGKSNAIMTGSLIFSNPKLDRREKFKRNILGQQYVNKKVFLYAENTRQRYNIRFHVFETFDEFLESCIDLVNAINKINGACLVVRLHSGRKIMAEDFKLLLPASDRLIVISSERPFSEILSITDLLINFSSTAIEDALQSHIPVFLYNRVNRYVHFESQNLDDSKNLVPSAVYYLNGTSYLREGLQFILDNHLNKNISRSIFKKYVFQENYFNNVVACISRVFNK